MDDGAKPMEDPGEVEQVRRQARKVRLQSLALAIVGTALAFAIPP
jgi:hypothetical protein